MELDDLKNTWNEMSSQVNEKQYVNPKIFDKMDNKKFHSKLNTIILPEIFGNAVCIASAVYIGFNFDKLDTITFKIIGVLTIVILVTLCVLSLISIQKLYTAADVSKPYVDTVKKFAVQKIRFCKMQKLNLVLSYLLLVTTVLLSTKLFGKNHITESKYFWVFSFSFGYIFLLLFSKWVAKKYNSTIRQTEDFLKDLSP